MALVNVKIWVRDPYPFSHKERIALEQALRQTYNNSIVYFTGFPAHYADVLNINVTTCHKLADTLRAVHLMQSALANEALGKNYCAQLEIAIQPEGSERPEWAKEQAHGN